jgi:hypothetical protein
MQSVIIIQTQVLDPITYSFLCHVDSCTGTHLAIPVKYVFQCLITSGPLEATATVNSKSQVPSDKRLRAHVLSFSRAFMLKRKSNKQTVPQSIQKVPLKKMSFKKTNFGSICTYSIYFQRF